MDFTMEEVLDFVACPTLYKFRHVDKIDARQTLKFKRPNKNSLIEMYDLALHKAIASIFHSMQAGTYPGLHHLARKWGHLWVKPRSDLEDVRFKEASWRDVHEKKRREGWDRLQSVWAAYRDVDFTPIMVDYHYRIPVGSHTLAGNIDLVRVVKNDQGREYIELVEFVTDYRNSPFLHVRRDWRVTAATLAFRKLMNVNEEKIVYHGVISGKLQTTERTTADHEQLGRLLDSIQYMKEAGVYYPVFNERCLTCPYQTHCEKGWYHAET